MLHTTSAMACFLHIFFYLLSQGLLTPWANEHLDLTNANSAEVFSTISPAKLLASPAPDLSVGAFSSRNRSDAGSASFPSLGDLNDQNALSTCLSMFDPCKRTFRMGNFCEFQNILMSCDKRCLVYGDCSPGFQAACQDTYEQALLFNASLPPQGEAKCLFHLGALVIADCPPSADVSTTLLHKCREGVKVNDEEFFPVMNAYNTLEYSNTFCALCNSVSLQDMIPWQQIVHVDVNALSFQKDVHISEVKGVHFIFLHALGNGFMGNDWVSWQFIPHSFKLRHCVPQEVLSLCDSYLTPSPSRLKGTLQLQIRWKSSHDNLKLVELTKRWEPEPIAWEMLVCRVEGASLTDCSIRSCVRGWRPRGGRCELIPIVRDFAVWVRLPPPSFLVELSDSDLRQLQSSSKSSRSSSSCSSSSRSSNLDDIFDFKIGADWTEEAKRELSSRALEVIQDAVRTSFHNVTIQRAYISKNVPSRWSARIIVTFTFSWSPKEPSYQPLIKECQLSSLRNMRRLLENCVALSKVLLCFNFDKKLQNARLCRGGVYLAEDATQGNAFSEEVLKEVEPEGNGDVTTYGFGFKLLLAFTVCINAFVVLIL